MSDRDDYESFKSHLGLWYIVDRRTGKNMTNGFETEERAWFNFDEASADAAERAKKKKRD